MSGPEERRCAVDLYSATPMTTAQVVRHLGHPTRQCLERWLAKDPGHAGHMAEPIIPLETRTKAVEPVPGACAEAGRNCSARASELSTTGSSVYGQINVYGVTTKSERHKRSYWTRTADGNGIGGRKAPVPYGS